MKVIAGDLKGRRFETPDRRGTRPALSRLRRALFDTLAPHLPQARFLDLFGGSGAFSYEALSRGAEASVIVESDRQVLSIIRKNADHLGISDRLEVVSGSVEQILPRLYAKGSRFDLIGVTPPYFKGLQDRTLASFQAYPLYTANALIFVQHHKSEKIKMELPGLHLERSRQYGTNVFTFFCPR